MSSNNQFSLLSLIATVKKYLWYVVALIGGSALLAIILTMPSILPPQFRAHTTLYPSNPERYDMNNIFAYEPNVYMYGTSKEVEKLGAIANSDEVALYVIDSLDLWSAYGIDKNGASPQFYVLEQYNGNVQITKGEGHGLLVEAYDVVPERAAQIVELIAARTDELNRKRIVQNKDQILAMFQENKALLEKEMIRYEDSTRAVREKYNIYQYDRQTEMLLEAIIATEAELAKAKAVGGNTRALQAKLDGLVKADAGYPINLEDFRKGLEHILRYEEFNERNARKMQVIEEKVQQLEMMNATEFLTVSMAHKPIPSDKKARPVRWLILAATLVMATVVSIFGVILIDQWPRMWEKLK